MSLFSNVFLACVERLLSWCLSSPLLDKPSSRNSPSASHGCILELDASCLVVWLFVRCSVLMSGDDSITAECDLPFGCHFGLLQSSLALVGATFFTLFSVALHSCFEGTTSFWSRSCTSDALVPSDDLTTLLPDSCFMSLHCGFEGRPVVMSDHKPRDGHQ